MVTRVAAARATVRQPDGRRPLQSEQLASGQPDADQQHEPSMIANWIAEPTKTA